MLHVIHWAGRRSKMENVIHRPQVVGFIHILSDEFKSGVTLQVRDVAHAAGNEIVHAHHAMALSQKRITKMRSDKPCAARHQYTHTPSFYSLFYNSTAAQYRTEQKRS